MKFTIPTKTLADALRIVSVCVTGGKSTLPILGNVKIEASKDELSFSTTNLDIFVTQKCQAKIEKKGALTVSFSLLNQLVARMKGSEVSIEEKGKAIIFKCGEVSASLETLSADEFPPTLPTKGENVEVDAAEILKPFTLLEHAICEPTSQRYILQGINICSGDNGTGHFTATNAARLLTYAGAKLVLGSVTVPHAFVTALLRIAPEGQIKIGISEGVISIKSESVELSSKLIEGTYPNWQTVIPERIESAFSCGREDMIDALKTCMIFTERQMPALELTGKGKEVEVSQGVRAKAMVLGTELAGQPDSSFRINAKLLVESLSVMGCDAIRLEFIDGRSQVLIEDGPLKCVINKLVPLDK